MNLMMNRGLRPRRNRLSLQRRERQMERQYEESHQPEKSSNEEEVRSYPHTMHYAGFWMRFWAFAFDSIMLLSIRGLIISPILSLTDIRYTLGAYYGGIDFIVSGLLFFAYFAIMTKYYGATIGKMVFGLKVVKADGSLLSWRDVIFREGIGRVLHQSFALLYVLYVTVAFTEKKQGLHDFVAHSYVIHERFLESDKPA